MELIRNRFYSDRHSCIPMQVALDQTKKRCRINVLYSNADSSDPSEPGTDEFPSFYEDTVQPLLQKLDEALNGSGQSSSPDFRATNAKISDWLSQTTKNGIGRGNTNGYETPNNAAAGLSKYHQRMLSPLNKRQRFMTGRYPLHVSVKNNPTRKWLRQVSSRKKGPTATSQVFVNKTIVDQSLASYDRLEWLDSAERKELAESYGGYSMMTMELIAEINVKSPGYVNLLPRRGAGLSAMMRRSIFDGSSNGKIPFGVWSKLETLALTAPNDKIDDSGDVDRLWITGFSISNPKGEFHFLDVDTCIMDTVDERTSGSIAWPNEVTSVPNQWHSNEFDSPSSHLTDTNGHNDTIRENNKMYRQKLDDALLVTDGFLVPGKDKGGLYVVRNPGNKDLEWAISLTGSAPVPERAVGGAKERDGMDNWFYHRAVWVDLTGDGRLSILTARAKRPSILKSNGGDTSPQEDLQNRQTDGQLVWLERPKPHSYDKTTGTPLNDDGTVFDPYSTRHTPWKVRVLDVGPDVMFSVADLDTTDNSVEVITSQFFGKKSIFALHRTWARAQSYIQTYIG
uniref:Uncharacterized protein n=1 Tax=Ditylum brightwellii TaxID=49249 RepID=A0A7S4QK00_9STRA